MSRSGIIAMVVLVFLMLSTIPSVYKVSADDLGDMDQNDINSSTIDTLLDKNMLNVDGQTEWTQGKGTADVVVLTTDAGELGRALKGIPYKGVVGIASNSGLSTPRLQIPSWAIDLVKSLPSTIGVYDYLTPEKHSSSENTAYSESAFLPTNIDGIKNHKVPEAWAYGYQGEGVEIAIVDDGVDLAHPDLLGTVARYNVGRIPSTTLNKKPWLATYDGWPISFDPTSMSAYFTSGGKAEGGWYANTTSTNDTVWHTVKIDGKNDFWTDGSEKVATDPIGDIVEIVGREQRLD